MKLTFVLLVVAAFAVLATTTTTTTAQAHTDSKNTSSPATFVMPWLCLERCFNWTRQDVQNHIDDIIAHKHLLSRVAFERYNLGPNGELVVNWNLTHVAPILRKAGLTTVAMISSFPYPPDFLDWMRFVFKDPISFLRNVHNALQRDEIDGVNFDWEPTASATTQDAQDYAQFLGMAQTYLGSRNKLVSADVAMWSNIWNLTAIGNAWASAAAASPATAPQITTMSTYTWHDSIFTKELNFAIAAVPSKSLLTIGLETFNQTNVEFRFNALQQAGICRVGIWSAPLNATWWNAIGNFLNDCRNAV